MGWDMVHHRIAGNEDFRAPNKWWYRDTVGNQAEESEVGLRGWAMGWDMAHHRVARDEDSRAPIRPWPVRMRSTAMQVHSEVMSQG